MCSCSDLTGQSVTLPDDTALLFFSSPALFASASTDQHSNEWGPALFHFYYIKSSQVKPVFLIKPNLYKLNTFWSYTLNSNDRKLPRQRSECLQTPLLNILLQLGIYTFLHVLRFANKHPVRSQEAACTRILGTCRRVQSLVSRVLDSDGLACWRKCYVWPRGYDTICWTTGPVRSVECCCFSCTNIRK